MKRILHVITGLELGGAEMLLVECADRGRSFGYDPLVVSLKAGGPNRTRLEARGVEVVELGLSPRAIHLRQALSVIRLANRFQPAITQSWLYDANLFTLMASYLSRSLAADRLVWGIFGTVPDRRHLSRRLKAVIRLGAGLADRPAAILYNAESARTDHEASGFRARRSIVCQNFIDTDLFRPDASARARIRAELGIPEGATVAIVAARHDPQKSWPLALEVLGSVEDLYTVAVGAGTEALPEQERLVRVGPRLDMPALYAGADMFLLSSGFGEGTSVAMSEAMACGLPVVVTDVGDNGRWAETAGFTVPIGDGAALRAAVDRLRADEPMRRHLGEAARRTAVEQFSAAHAVEPLFALYDEVTRGSAASRAQG